MNVEINSLFVLVSSTLVFFMITGLSMFYAGLVPAKNAINTLKLNFFAMAGVIFFWIILGYSIAFSGDNPYIGDLSKLFLGGTFNSQIKGLVNEDVFAIFQMMFAMIAAALISGAVVERIELKAFILFVIMWSLFFYCPTVHWVWSSNGWLKNWGILDYAGGFAIHVGAGFSALTLAIMVKPRKFKNDSQPHNVTYVVIGVCMLWFGYYGFNSGSSLSVDNVATISFINTALAPSTAIFTWLILDIIRKKQISAINIGVATIIGLVSITPSAGFIQIHDALIISFVTTVIGYFAFLLGSKIKHIVDDTLDVFVCHGLCGFVGLIFTGVFATSKYNSAITGDLTSYLIIKQLLAAIFIAIYAIVVTFLIVVVLKVFIKIRVTEEEEKVGLDIRLNE